MNRIQFLVISAVAAVALLGGAVQAGTSGAVYDMSRMLGEAHPFAGQAAQPAEAPQRAIPTTPRREPAVVPRRQMSPPAPTTPVRTSRELAQSPMASDGDSLFSEIRVGAMLHDQGPFSSNKEGGFDSNIELLFTSPDFLSVVWSPRPHIGASINSAGDTSQAYAGLTWGWDFFERDMFVNFSLGGAVHTGETTTDRRDKKELGCRALFRESLNVGYRFNDVHSVMLHLDHISNAKLCSTNEGLESFGVRYGYSF